jgi:TIR domain
MAGLSAVSGRIFINYRRGDEPGYTQALFQQLEAAFGRSNLFMDVEGYIKAGDDFVEAIEGHVAACEVLLAVIGPRWIDVRDHNGQRRLDDQDDFVRIEIAAALKQGKRVIPILVNNAQMFSVDDLPEPLRPLARRNAVSLRQERFIADCLGLIKDIRGSASVAGKDATQPAAANASNYAIGLILALLAILCAWIAVTFFRDAQVSRILALLFSAASLFFVYVSVAAFSKEFKRRSDGASASREQ